MSRPNLASAKATALGVFAFCLANLAHAQDCVMPPTPLPVRVVQEDGTPLLLRLKGTGQHNWYEDLDGHLVLRVGESYQFARLDGEGQLQATGFLVGKMDPGQLNLPRAAAPSAPTGATLSAGSSASGSTHGMAGKSASQTPGPLPFLSGTGTVKNLVVLLRFNGHGPGGQNRNLPSTSDVGDIMNAVGGDPGLAPTGSVRDHYLEDSYGQLTIDSTVTVWVDVPGSESYYANGNSGLTSKTWELIIDGLNGADSSIDFSQFDLDGDNVIDAITFLHSGYGAEWGGTDSYGTHYSDRMWSHKWSIPGWTSAEGVSVSTYNISPGLWATSGSSPGRIGVVCHELGHFFGLPDLYDTDGSSNGLGNWCLMAAGSWGFDGSQHYPSHMSAWAKSKMGWLQPQTILSGTYGLPRVEDTPTIFKVDSGYPPGEYLLIENRAAWGFDAQLPTEGLAVWHVDETKGSFGANNPNTDEGYPGQSGWPNNGKHYRIALLQADNDYDLEKDNNRGDSGDLYHAGGVSSVTNTSSPSTDAYQPGSAWDNGNDITGIGSAGAMVSMTLSNSQAPSISTSSLASAPLGSPYVANLNSSGGDAPLVWSEHLPSPSYDVADLGASAYASSGSAKNWKADEGIWPLDLPFQFPFYDGSYDRVYVSSNGFIEFAPTESEPYNSPYVLRASRRIAPMWADLTTAGGGSQDIFVDTSVSGQVGIRWRAETYNGGNSVRIAVVLFADGRIRFDYGTGNSGAYGTVGISRGEGGFLEVPASHDNNSNLGSANSLMFTLLGSDLPPGLIVASDGTVSGTPSLAGTYNPWFRVTDDKFRYDVRQLSLQVSSGADCNGNGIADSTDISSGTSQDCNGNGVPDECELAGNDCNSNGIPDDCELAGDDCNSNGTLDACEGLVDCNSNGTPDECETLADCNSNGTPDECEAFTDCNSNNVPDECELAGNDCNTNGIPDDCELAADDCNSNGTLDSCETLADCNSNGTPDECEAFTDCNSNNVPDECELAGNDCNTNGIPDDCELVGNDCNTNGIPDDCELSADDCNSNGTLDSCETLADCNSNGTPDECEAFTDCNSNNVPDECELAGNDCNTNGIPDDCELASDDCNSNGTLDSCEALADCNSNGTPDECEAITDCNANNIPDECELVGNDCNANGIPDDCELAGDDCNSNGTLDSCETLADCNSNGTPDECEAITDCNANNIPDECELVGNDCNANGIPDDCELASDDCNSNGTLDSCESLADCNSNGTPDECEAITDCNANNIPDECELVGNDCNANGIPDDCELAGNDCNSNGIPDDCDISGGGSLDLDLNGIPDECAPGTAYCFGSIATCPCGAAAGPDEGCANSALQGAKLTATGLTSFSNDTLVFTASGVPGNKPGLLLRGNNMVSLPAGDGVLCVAGQSNRSQVQVTSAGTTVFSNFSGGGFGSVANSGGAPTNFQFWYRDPANVCSGAGFNFSNAYSVVYTP